jgi:serine/threonine protein kinase
VLDFGVSKLVGQGSLTRDQLVGTPEYMAPEQAAGHGVDHRVDIYGLAAVLYRCVAMRAPFVNDSLPVLVHKVVHEMPPRPGRFARLVPDVEAFLAVGLAKRPEDRFQSGRELAEAFEAATRGELQAHWRERAAVVLSRSPWIE